MNLLYDIRQKGKITILLIAVVFLIILSSNTYNEKINQMGDSFSEMYSDRLLAQDYIYKLADILHHRKYTLASKNVSDIDEIFKDYGIKISQLLANYEKTQLTKNESIQFKEFKKNVLVMILLEKKYLNSTNKDLKANLLRSQSNVLNLSLIQLDLLSEIQISRGKNLNDDSKKIVSFSSLLNQFDWALIIIIGLIIQVLIFTAKSSIPKHPQNQNLN